MSLLNAFNELTAGLTWPLRGRRVTNAQFAVLRAEIRTLQDALHQFRMDRIREEGGWKRDVAAADRRVSDIEQNLRRDLFQIGETLNQTISAVEEDFRRNMAEVDAGLRRTVSETEDRLRDNLFQREQSLKGNLSVLEQSARADLVRIEHGLQYRISDLDYKISDVDMGLRKHLALGHSDLPVVLCAGLPRSGSTWAFNALLEVIRLRSTATGVFADEFGDEIERRLSEFSRVVVKCHIPDSSVRMLARYYGAPVVMTVRDPRDCVTSSIQQFGSDFDTALKQISESAQSMLRIADAAPTLVLKYETPGSIGVNGVLAIAEHVGYSISHNDAEVIAASLGRTEVADYISKLIESGVLDGNQPPAGQYDPATHWHPNHIGDGASGKFGNVLTEEQAEEVRVSTKEFCDRFGYAAVDAERNDAA